MTDTLSPTERSKRMSLIGGKGTKPEMAVRRILTRHGYRYRLHRKDLPGKPDIVLASRRKAIFVHGCFWHRHDAPSCTLARLPKSRLDFWLPKLTRNSERDRAKETALRDAGWNVLVIWECELALPDKVETRLLEFVGMRATTVEAPRRIPSLRPR